MSSRFFFVVLAGVVATLTFGHAAMARDQSPEEVAALDHMPNPQEVALTEDQVKRYIAFAQDHKVALKKIGDVQGKPEDVERAVDEVNAIPAKHGFNRLGDLIDIRHTINSIVSRFNNETGEYIDMMAKGKKILDEKSAESLVGKTADEIAELQNDIKILKQDLATTKPPMPANIALVGKYKKELLKSLRD